MAEISLRISDEKVDQLKVREIIAIQKVTQGIEAEPLRNCIARFMTNENGEYLEWDSAIAVINELSRPEFIQVITQFAKAYQDYAANPTNTAAS